MTGVYRIVNKVNGKCYVGMSQVSIEGRVYSHFNGRGSKLLESAIRKYGSDSFDVEVLEESSERTGDKNSFYGKHHSDETRRVLSEEASKRNKGRHWYTNGEENKFLTEDQAKDFLVDNPNFRPGKTRVSSSTTIESVDGKKDSIE